MWKTYALIDQKRVRMGLDRELSCYGRSAISGIMRRVLAHDIVMRDKAGSTVVAPRATQPQEEAETPVAQVRER